MISVLIIVTLAHKAHRSNTVLAALGRAMDSVPVSGWQLALKLKSVTHNLSPEQA